MDKDVRTAWLMGMATGALAAIVVAGYACFILT